MIGEVLALDYDDCFKPFTRPFLGYVHEKTGVQLKPEDGLPGFYHFDEAHPECGINAEEFAELIDEFMFEQSVEVRPYPDAVQTVSKLAKICEVHVVTARNPRYEAITLESIDRYIGIGLLKGVHVIGSLEGDKKTTKTNTYFKIGATSTADDADHNINAAIEAGLTGFSVQYPGVYHSGHRLDSRAIVISSLSEILKYAKTSVG